MTFGTGLPWTLTSRVALSCSPLTHSLSSCLVNLGGACAVTFQKSDICRREVTLGLNWPLCGVKHAEHYCSDQKGYPRSLMIRRRWLIIAYQRSTYLHARHLLLMSTLQTFCLRYVFHILKSHYSISEEFGNLSRTGKKGIAVSLTCPMVLLATME